MTEVYPIEADGGGSAREVRAIRRKDSITSAQRVCARRRRWRRLGRGTRPHLRDMPKMRASSRSTSEGSSSAHMAENSRVRKSTVHASPSSTSPADRMRLSSRYARHLVAEHLVDAHVGPDDDLLFEGPLVEVVLLGHARHARHEVDAPGLLGRDAEADGDAPLAGGVGAGHVSSPFSPRPGRGPCRPGRWGTDGRSGR